MGGEERAHTMSSKVLVPKCWWSPLSKYLSAKDEYALDMGLDRLYRMVSRGRQLLLPSFAQPAAILFRTMMLQAGEQVKARNPPTA